jgi:hypothetical protein
MPFKTLTRGSSAEPDVRSDAVRLGVCVVRVQASATLMSVFEYNLPSCRTV